MIRQLSAGLPVVLAGVLISACSPPPGALPDVEHYAGEPDLVIENERAGLAAEFGRVTGLALDSAGRIYVADALAHEVRVFDADGAHVYTIGREGAGPGEFSGPCCPAFDDRGRLWVRDGGNARYIAFEAGATGARVLSTVRMSHSDVNRTAPTTFDDAGRVIDIGILPDERRPARRIGIAGWGAPAGGGASGPGSSALPRVGRSHLDERGAVIRRTAVPSAPPESLGMHAVTDEADGGNTTYYLYQPFGPLELVAHGPGGEFAYALGSRYSIAWFDEYGDTLRVIARPGEQGPPLSDSERELADQRIDASVQQVGASRGGLPFGVPERKPPLHDLYFDADGRLWVELSAPAGEARRAHVYGADGTLVFTAAWPAAISILDNAIRGNTALGVARDSLDVQRVVRLRFWRKR